MSMGLDRQRLPLLIVLALVPLGALADKPAQPRATDPAITVRPTTRPSAELVPLIDGVVDRETRVLHDERTNQLIVVGNRRDQRRARALVRRLDRIRGQNQHRNQRIFVHRLQNTRARDTQRVLQLLRRTRGNRIR